MKLLQKIAVVVLMLSAVSCEKYFDYSPYVIRFEEESQDLNNKNILLIKSREESDTLLIAFTGDSHNYFDELGFFVEKANSLTNIDFVIHVGDIADFGLPKQYSWGNGYLSQLNQPYLVLIGNHDLVGNGQEAYNEMFGVLDFSFIYDQIKFIFLNTNSLEFANNGTVPDLSWLKEELKPSAECSSAAIICHVPPNDADFDSNLEAEFYQTISTYHNVLMVVHGHQHHHEIYYPTADSIPFINVYGVEHRMMNTIEIIQNQIHVKNVSF